MVSVVSGSTSSSVQWGSDSTCPLHRCQQLGTWYCCKGRHFVPVFPQAQQGLLSTGTTAACRGLLSLEPWQGSAGTWVAEEAPG